MFSVNLGIGVANSFENGSRVCFCFYLIILSVFPFDIENFVWIYFTEQSTF